MKKKITFRTWSIKDLDIDTVIAKHIELVTTPRTELINWEEYLTCDTKNIKEPIYKVIGKIKPIPRKDILYHKYIFLIHIIIAKCENSKDGTIRLNYNVLKEVLGRCIGDMLNTLKKLNIINISPFYKIGEYSRLIWLCNWNITHKDITNFKVIEYSNKIKKILGDRENSTGNYTKKFINSYNETLSMLKMPYKKEALEYLSRKEFATEHSKLFYYSRINNFQETENIISSIDKNNRIYHYLTNTPKSLKKFFNIKFQADICNSHPLLFSKYLIRKYNLKYDFIKELCRINLNIDTNRSSIRYEGKQLRNILKNKQIEVPKVKDLPHDIIVYIYRTSKGYFWDDFKDLFKDMERGEVKVALFREIFYSLSTTVKHKNFGKLFVERYPNVWKIIRSFKMEKDSLLPNKMMQLESEIFKDILARCFNIGWQVVNIHDAIIVLDTNANIECRNKDIENIISTVYEQYSLFPSISIETFSPQI